jgi:putative DNA primase/helicase
MKYQNGASALLERPTLLDRHRKELVDIRGLPLTWIEKNCRSVTLEEASQYLGYRAKSPGILLEGHGIQIQFKPDRPWKNDDDKKAPKYRSPLGEYDAMLPICPDDPTYWKDLEALKAKCYQIEEHPCLVVTEGYFKAIAGCSIGIPTIALLGIEMGLTATDADPQGKRYLVEMLEIFARAEFGFIIVYDSDCASNPDVTLAQLKLGAQLLKFGVPVYSCTGLWSMEQGKGMDDFIQQNGIEKFKNDVLASAIAHKEWAAKLEKQFDTGSKKKEKIPPADVIGAEIMEEYRDRLIWSDEHKSWMEYSLDHLGVWTPVSDAYLESAVDTILEAKGIVGYGSARYVTNIISKMRRQLFTREWGERSSELLPFTDGVYDLKTGKFNAHAPGYRLTWCLPRPYNAIASSWTTIDTWLNEATQGNQRDKEVLLCFAAAVLRGRSDLQKFLHLIGVGGSGKSTFTRLLEALIGSRNCFVASLQELSDKHTIADLMNKRLAILPDQEKLVGSLSNFKRLTGQDPLNGRRLYKDALNFRFDGMAVVTSNGPIFHAGGGSWLTRRILMIAFDCKPNKIRDLEAEFEPELSAFTNHLLSIPNEEITRVLRGLGKGDVQKPLWEAQIRTDSIAAWVNEWVLSDPTAKTLIGSDRNEWNDTAYDASTSTLFGSYSLYCRNTGLQLKGKNNFSSDLIELCRQTLGWKVEYCRGGTGQRMIRGLRLRGKDDTDPTLEDRLTSDNPDNPSDNPSDNPEALINKEYDNPDNLDNQNFSATNDLISVSPQSEIEVVNADIKETEKVLASEVVRASETPTNQASQVVRQVVRQVVSVVGCQIAGTDYSTFPHLTCDTIEAKRNQAEKIKQMLLEAESREELIAVKQEFSTRCHWVWKNCLTKTQRSKLKAIASVKQLDLLVPSPTGEEEWFSQSNLLCMAEELAQCESAEQLDLLRQCWLPEAMNLACKQLSPEKHAQIKQWVVELNRAKTD